MKTKRCSGCKIEKSIHKYHKNKNKKDGLSVQCKKCAIDRAKAWAKSNPERAKKNSRKANKERHGISYGEYERLLAAQNNRCAICDRTHQNLSIDHDHACCPGHFSCGACIRGLLCHKCNTALGLLNENVDTIESMKKYLGA